MEELFKIAVISVDENLGRQFLEKIRKGIPKISLEISLLSDAKQTLLFLERYRPAVIFLARQIPGIKISDLLKHIDLHCPHAQLVWLDPDKEGLSLEPQSERPVLGIPVLEWEKVVNLVEDEIPTELKFRFGMARRETQVIKKIKIHAGELLQGNRQTYPTLAYIPDSFVATSVKNVSKDSKQHEVLIKNADPSKNHEFPAPGPTGKQEWGVVLFAVGLAIIFHLPWAERGNWLLLRSFFDFLAGVSVVGLLLRTTSEKIKSF